MAATSAWDRAKALFTGGDPIDLPQFAVPRHDQIPVPTDRDVLIADRVEFYDVDPHAGVRGGQLAESTLMVTIAGIAVLPHHDELDPQMAWFVQKRNRGRIGPIKISPRVRVSDDFPPTTDPRMLGPIETSIGLPGALIVPHVEIVSATWRGTSSGDGTVLLVRDHAGTTTELQYVHRGLEVALKFAAQVVCLRYAYELAHLMGEVVRDLRGASGAAPAEASEPGWEHGDEARVASVPWLLDPAALRSLGELQRSDPFLLALFERASAVVEDYAGCRHLAGEPLLSLL